MRGFELIYIFEELNETVQILVRRDLFYFLQIVLRGQRFEGKNSVAIEGPFELVVLHRKTRNPP